MNERHETYEQSAPTCPGCGYVLDSDDMNSGFSDDDLFALAPNEERTSVKCPQCDTSYWVQGGYKPTYTSSFNEDDL
jgi:predicted RNA-binding Zn-ribbon protein involved in translation (DUF1610 family)